MSQVTLAIGGRSYTLACAEGEEAHVMRLGRLIDEKVGTVTNGKPASEAQSLLFAALMLADELHETRMQSRTEEQDKKLAETLEECAERLENCAAALESHSTTP